MYGVLTCTRGRLCGEERTVFDASKPALASFINLSHVPEHALDESVLLAHDCLDLDLLRFKAERAVVPHLSNVSKEALLERARLHAANVELQYLENVNLCLLK